MVDGRQRQLTGSAAIDGAAVAINSGNGASGSGGGGTQRSAKLSTLWTASLYRPSFSIYHNHKVLRMYSRRGHNVKKMKEVWYYLL